jgi:hypothetical protein
MPRARLCLLGLAAAGCGLDTDLGASRAGRALDAGQPAQGLLELIAPQPNRQDVAPNLGVLVLRSPTAVAGARLALRTADGASLALGSLVVGPCADEVEAGGACYESAVPAPLIEGSSYTLELAAMAAAPARALAHFTTARAADREPPVLGEVALVPAADCLRVRGSGDEPLRAALVVRVGDAEEILVGAIGGAAFDFAARVTRFPPGAEATAEVAVWDLAGNRSASPAIPLRVPPPPASLAITEVLANPGGAEGRQELVELRNLGPAPVPLEGLVLEDDAGGDALPAALLAPGGYAVIVPADFVVGSTDAANPDPPPAADATLVRVGGRLGKDGLGAHEGVRLRGRDGAVLSSYGGWVDQGSTAWNGHSVHRLPAQDACDHPRAWTRSPLPPTPGW